MLDAFLFEKLEFIARKLRNNKLPFGVIQLVLFGDFFQLPPVLNKEQDEVKYAFESPLWDAVIMYNIK